MWGGRGEREMHQLISDKKLGGGGGVMWKTFREIVKPQALSVCFLLLLTVGHTHMAALCSVTVTVFFCCELVVILSQVAIVRCLLCCG